MEQQLLTTADLAARYGVAIRTAAGWMRRYPWPNKQQLGRIWIVPESDLEGWVPPTRGNRTSKPRQ